MSPKAFIISVSLAGSAAALACWMFAGGTPDRTTTEAPTKAARPAPARNVATFSPATKTARAENSVVAAPPAAAAQSRQRPVPVPPLTAEELTARAARVEQEANHDLRRLVALLDLSEEQQDKVFQTLAQHSPSWTPGLQFAPTGGTDTVTAGKRSNSLTAGPGIYAPPAASDTTAPAKTPAKAIEETTPPSTDPMDEIMALLDPGQQDALLQEEMDRTAWWAEILEQITPPDDVPSIDGSKPAPAPVPTEPQTYEGADVLE